MDVLFLGMEATFAFVFWAMHSPDQDYRVGHQVCLWNAEDLEYDGLCSHSSVVEGGHRQHGLTDEEYEDIATKLVQQRK
jgi:hypothetical protein